MNLRDKTFVITGGTTDIGRALCLALAQEGADIAIVDKNAEKANRIVAEVADLREVKESNGRAAYVEADISKQAAVKEAMSRAAEIFGGIDVLIAGLTANNVVPVDHADYLAEFERLIDINLKSAVYATHYALPAMKSRRRGKLIYLIPDLIRWGFEEESLVSVTRGGLIYFAKALARELGPFNITANCVSVGPTEDYMLNRDPKLTTIKQAEEKLSMVMPMGRILRADEVAQVISFLSSSKADAVTGQTWAVNGGLTM